MYTSPWRSYRGRCRPARGEIAFQVVVEQTDLWVVAESDLSRTVHALVNECRGLLSAYIAWHPDFLTSLQPVEVEPGAPEIVQAMARAGQACGVGPMAAVAGAIAQWVAQRCVEKSSNLLVENGGDLFLCSTRERVIGLLVDPTQNMGLGLRLTPPDFPCSLCSSSATIGHSLSLGRGNLLVTRSRDAALADAAATALNNLVAGPQDLGLVMDQARRLADKGLDGVFAQCGEEVGIWGKMELVSLE
jgi:ApbE superfamily uncharacterized protein (UPF0280 family)